jgi:hypothetical protein
VNVPNNATGGLYELTREHLSRVDVQTFSAAGVRERADLQRLLRANVEVISPNTMVVAEEFGEFEGSRRRIDLLAIDTDANIVVIELKRDETGAHMELQALRYAAFVSTMNFDQVVDAYCRFAKVDAEQARDEILRFLDWEQSDVRPFGQEVRIVLAAADFSSELMSTVVWLNERWRMGIRCVRLRPYQIGERLFVDVEQLIPLPEAADFQVRVREKAEIIRTAVEGQRDLTRYDLDLGGQRYPHLAKRKLMFLVVQAAVNQAGATPDEVANMSERKSPWAVAQGTYSTSDDFARDVAEQYAAVGRPFDPGRWFIDSEDLFHVQNRTLAFSKMWSGDDVLRAVERIKARYPALGIAFEACG